MKIQKLEDVLEELIILTEKQKERWINMPKEFFEHRRKGMIKVAMNKLKFFKKEL